MKNPLLRTLLVTVLFFYIAPDVSHSQAAITGTTGFPIGTSINGVAYGNGIYVAAGNSGYILKSTDGLNWTVDKTSSFINTNYSRVVFGNGLFVAIASDGKIITSADGTTWTQQTSGTSNMLNDIIYANGIFLAVGNNNTTLSSANGTTWSAINIGAAGTDLLLSVSYSGSKFVVGVRDAATDGSKSFYSSSGAAGTWSSATIANYVSLNKICYINNRFFCFTAATTIYTSTDGASWSTFTNARLTGTNQIFHGLYDGTTYYFFGSSTENAYGSVFTSTDGSTFTLQAQSTTLVNTAFSAYVNGKYYQGGGEGLVISTNGSTWRFPAGAYNAVASSGTRYVAVGQVTGTEAAIFSSPDWNTWTNVAPGVIKPLNGVAYGGGKFVAVGNTNSSGFGTVAVSGDGVSWSAGSSGVADNLRAVAYGSGKFVAVGLNGRIVYSSDGVSWTSAETGSGYHYFGISYINNYFVAVGGSTTANTGQAKVKYSSNGTSWTDVSPSITGHFHSITYGGGKYLLVGRDNTSTSYKFFSVITTDITSAAGFSAPLTATTPEGDIGTIQFGSVAYANSIFVAMANLKAAPYSAYVLTSATGTSWTATAANSTSRLRSVIATGSSFKAVGTADARYSIAAGTTLPVRLLGFQATDRGSSVLLTWQTSHEANADRFEVERSNNGTVFGTIGSVPATNRTAATDYSLTDNDAGTGSLYYRLKMLDADGRFTYSDVVRITRSAARQLSLYPNPAGTSSTLYLPHTGNYSVTVHNSQGKQVLAGQGHGTSHVLRVESFPAGLYIVSVQQGDRIFTTKLIKK